MDKIDYVYHMENWLKQQPCTGMGVVKKQMRVEMHVSKKSIRLLTEDNTANYKNKE